MNLSSLMLKFSSILFIVLFLFTACSEDPIPVENGFIEKQYKIRATGFETWQYFSFEKGRVVSLESSNSLDWDLAFQRTRIRTNSGISGIGEGGAWCSPYLNTGFNDLNEVPANAVFSTDDSIKVDNTKYLFNLTLSSWFRNFTYRDTNEVVREVINPTDSIFIVRTAKGKFAKVWFQSYYDTAWIVKPDSVNNFNGKFILEAGVVYFKYQYQGNGSATFAQ